MSTTMDEKIKRRTVRSTWKSTQSVLALNIRSRQTAQARL